MNAPLNKEIPAPTSTDGSDMFAIGDVIAVPAPVTIAAPQDDVFTLGDFQYGSYPSVVTAELENVFLLGERVPTISIPTIVPPDTAVAIDISNAEYHSIRDLVSCSMLKEILRSPAHLIAEPYKEKKELPSQRIGTGFHAATLEMDRFLNEYVIFDGTRRGQKWTDFQSAYASKNIITQYEHDTILGMRAAVLNYTELPLRQAIEMGDAEKSIFWKDATTGVGCRIRPDLLLQVASYLMLDLKSIDDCRPDSFMRQIFRMDYDLQAAMYIEGAYHLTGVWMPFYLVACEIAPPHGVWVYEVRASESDPIYRNGLNKLRSGLSTYKKCLETGKWPGYNQPFSTSGSIHVPSYYLSPLAEDAAGVSECDSHELLNA